MVPGNLALVCLTLMLVTSASQQVQESVEWKFHRSLYDYKNYGAVTLQRIHLPAHSLLVNLSSRVEASSASCKLRYVTIFANQFGLPVVSRDKESFPANAFVRHIPVLNVSVSSNNQTVLWHMSHVRAGELFLLGVMPQSDYRIKQKGLEQDCDYHLTTRAVIQHYQEWDIQELELDTAQMVTMNQTSGRIFSFRVSMDSVLYTVSIHGCDKTLCPLNVSVWESAPYNTHKGVACVDHCIWVNGSCRIQVTSPTVDSLNYLSIETYETVSIQLSIQIDNTFCSMSHNNSDPQLFTTKGTSLSCVFEGELGRLTPNKAPEGSNFHDQFVWWDEELSPVSPVRLNTSDMFATVTRFMLRTSDTGTSLKFSLHVHADKSSNNITRVYACLSHHRLLHRNNCLAGAMLNVTNQEVGNKADILVPYPQSGPWFISVSSQCLVIDQLNKSQEVSVPCQSSPEANVSVQLSPCVDGGCGTYGTCKLYVGADVLYSACSCFSGWRGYGCNDGSQADNAAEEQLGVYLLTLSNLGFIPGICVAARRRLYVEAFVYSYNMFFSTFYHACDTSQIYQMCLMQYSSLSYADFFASLLSFWITLMAMAKIPSGLRSFLHMLSAMFVSLGVVHDRHGLLEQLLPIVLGVAIVLVSWGLECYKRKTMFPSKRRLLKFILPGLSLSCLGLVFNLVLETESNYRYMHSLWHVLESASIVFLLPPGRHNSGKSSQLSVQSGDIARQALPQDDLAYEANIQQADDTNEEDESSRLSQPASPTDTSQ